MKKIIIFSVIALTLSLFNACIHEGDLEIEPVPDILFEYVIDGMTGTGTFTSIVSGTTNITWTTSDGGSGSGETFTYLFPKAGSYWVTMTGTYNGVVQSVSTKVLVAKTARVSMTDNTIADWDKVDYEDFTITTFNKQDSDGRKDGGLKLVKVDYNSNYVYFHIVWDAKEYEGGTGTIDVGGVTKEITYPAYSCNDLICQFYIDSDNDSETGSIEVDGSEVEGFGWEYMFETELAYLEDDIEWYSADGPDVSGKTTIGFMERDANDVFRIEFGIERDALKLTGEEFSFVIVTFDDDWTNKDNTFNELPIVIKMNKTE